jgi:thioredoxin-dependent peroxiredoxin
MRYLLAIASLVLSVSIAADSPAVGADAPEFRLQDQNNDWHSLGDYQGQWVALYFYPKADTPGCTTEACAFRDDIMWFRERGVAILGVSLDDVESQAEFAEKYHLPFPLLSDREAEVAELYDVLRGFGPLRYAHRETFLINPEGVVAKHYDSVDPETHSVEVQAELSQLMDAEE